MPDILIRGVSMLDTGNYFAMVENETQHQPNVTIWKRKTDGSLERFGFGEVVELPPHGDLISRTNALAFPLANGKYDHENANKHFIFGCETYKEYLEQVPVIVPADKEDTPC